MAPFFVDAIKMAFFSLKSQYFMLLATEHNEFIYNISVQCNVTSKCSEKKQLHNNVFYQTSESSPIKKRNTEVARYPYEQLCLFTYGDLQCCRKHARITKLTHTKYQNQPHNHAVICQYRPSTGNLPKESSQGQRLQKSYIATTTDSNQLTKQQYANWENIRMDLFFIFQK